MSRATTTAAPPRRQFRLTGSSVTLDEGHYAVRRDLAEIAVADRIFAQHYVEPVAARLNTAATIHARPDGGSAEIVKLGTGSVFHLVDLGHDWAWGRGDAPGTVGYVATSALDLP